MNRKLVELYSKKLLKEFRTKARNQLLQPWWWPNGAGASLSEWGLHPDADPDGALLQSLQGKPHATLGREQVYTGFNGSLGCTSNRCERWILSSRPSSGDFPSGTTTRLVRLLAKLNWLPTTHVCDVFKFRGLGPDAKADLHAPPRHWDLSLDLLEKEFAITDPAIILVAGRKAQKWVDLRLEQYSRERRSRKLAKLLDRIAHVTSWMAPVDTRTLCGEWERAAVRPRTGTL